MSQFVACLKALLVVAGPLSAAGHAYLAEPPSRNLVASRAGTETCPHCLQSGGPSTVKERANGVWPTKNAPNSHGLCGNPVQNHPVPVSLAEESYLVQGPVQRTYTAGEIVTFAVGVNAHHMGHYEFRICDQGLDRSALTSWQEGQDCLNKWVLERAEPLTDCVPNDSRADCQPIDEDHPERWHLPPAKADTQVATASWSDSNADPVPAIGEVHTMRYKIPESLSCERCTLQWYYSTGNSCYYDGGYITYFKRMAELGWDASEWVLHGSSLDSWVTCENTCCGPQTFGEEFWNCADIAVLSSGQGGSTTQAAEATTAPSMTTTPPMTTAMSQGASTTTAAAPSPSGGTCAETWGQCGGQGWTGTTCCVSGSTCVELNAWFSMCEPSSVVEAVTTAAPRTTTAAPATTMDGACAEPWQQCGGKGWTGTTCCVSGFVCTELSEWHSQCNPGGSRRLQRLHR